VFGAEVLLEDDATTRKARGAFFTPPEICRSVAEWAIRSPADRVMEPSCGDAAFLRAATDRLRALGAPLPVPGSIPFGQIQAVELHRPSAHQAAAVATRAGIPATILEGDFFDLDADPRFDAVIWNPPYVRYQDFTGAARLKAQRRAVEAGRPMSGLASSWASFVLHASRFLAPGGRLGLVLPAELLSVNYAAPVRSFLLESFGRVELVLFEERVFPGVMEEVVLLLAEGPGASTNHFTVRQVRDLDALTSKRRASSSWAPRLTAEKWLPALLPVEAANAYAGLTNGAFTTLAAWGGTHLGSVTGNNRYFALTPAEVQRWGLRADDLLPISPPGSRHLRGVTFTTQAWDAMAAAGAPVFLFYPGEEPSEAAQRYIDHGLAGGVQEAYKCRVRTPWWRVPVIATPDLFLTYMNHDTPRLVSNDAGVRHLNSIHGVTLKPEHRAHGSLLLPIASLNSATALGAELVGRAYGGGMLKLEPREAGRLPVPTPELVAAAGKALRAIVPRLGEALRGGALDAATEMVDRILLIDGAGLGQSEVRNLRAARAALFARRVARS
jgi:adenine-specific DNA-methyltransferase